jgi:hypothetical protein
LYSIRPAETAAVAAGDELRGCDVVITVSQRRGRRLTPIAWFEETESQIPRAHTVLALLLPTRRLQGGREVRLVLHLVATDAAGRQRSLSERVTLRR